MTGLRNFTSFTEDLEDAHNQFLESKHPYSLLEFDTDHFKRINDRYGHPAGNRVLRAVAKATHDYAGEQDYQAHAYRVGGEEFALILHADLSAGDEAVIARDLRRRISDLRFKGTIVPVRLSISIGVAPVSTNDANYLSIYTSVDSYLYQVKQNGRDGAAIRGDIVR